MNTPLRRVSLVVMGLIVLLLGQATWVQVVKADEYKANPYNQRVLLDEYNRQRGQISAGGEVLASSVPTDDRFKYLRQYSNGPMYAPVTGYYSLVYGTAGIERAEDAVLNGSADQLFVRRISDVVTGRTPAGGNVAPPVGLMPHGSFFSLLLLTAFCHSQCKGDLLSKSTWIRQLFLVQKKTAVR